MEECVYIPAAENARKTSRAEKFSPVLPVVVERKKKDGKKTTTSRRDVMYTMRATAVCCKNF